jgi:hypothetical protein
MPKPSLPLSITFDIIIRPVCFAFGKMQRWELTIDIEGLSLAFLSEYTASREVQELPYPVAAPHSISAGYLSMVVHNNCSGIEIYRLCYAPAEPDEILDWKVVPFRPTAHVIDEASPLCPSSGRMAYCCGSGCLDHVDGEPRAHLIEFLCDPVI